jgi:putative protease
MSEAQGFHQQDYQRPELVCPAGTPAAFRTAVDAGADAVYCGLQNETNARNFPGLNFTMAEVEQSLAYAHARNSKLLLAVNTFPPAGKFDLWRDAIDGAAKLGVDAVIVADMGVADYAARSYPDLRLHLSVQAGASSPEAIRFYCEQFGVKRVVLPRMLTVAEIAELHSQIPCEIEAFIFGNIGMMAEGRCSLSNYVTGESTNMDGVCSPAAAVHYEEDAARNLTAIFAARKTPPITPSRSRSVSICQRCCPT